MYFLQAWSMHISLVQFIQGFTLLMLLSCNLEVMPHRLALTGRFSVPLSSNRGMLTSMIQSIKERMRPACIMQFHKLLFDLGL